MGNKAELKIIFNTKTVPIQKDEKLLINLNIEQISKTMGMNIEKFEWSD